MKEFFFNLRDNFTRFIYKSFLRRIFFLIDAEDIHDGAVIFGRWLGRCALGRAKVRFWLSYSHPVLEQEILGIKFRNPVGLAAGFDKNALLLDILPAIGFGFAEVGSITGESCPGNSRPRLWRLVESEALAVNYGLKNDGAKTISTRLRGRSRFSVAKARLCHRQFDIPFAVNIAKTNNPECADTEKGMEDYLKACRYFYDVGDFLVINISCPNVFGGQPFHEAEKLEKLLQKVRELPLGKPVFLKISPDLTKEEINGVLEMMEKYKINGLVCANLTKNRQNSGIKENNVPAAGGISGRPVRDLADELIGYVYQKTGGKFIIIGCGGIFSASDAYRKIKLGASLVELITGMIYEGPQLVSEINRGLVRLLRQDGFENISQAVGKAHK